MDILKQGAQNLKSLGFGALVPDLRDRVLNVVTGEVTKTQDDRIKALEAEVAAGRKTREQAKAEMGMKAGGKVSSKLKNAGFYDKDKTTSERKKIVSKVTTKPQRLGMVEKMFSAKKMKSGGAVSSASKRADGCAVKGKTKGRVL